MASYSLTKQAEEDFEAIGIYSPNRWGLMQAGRYLRELGHCFAMPIKDGRLGQDRAGIRPKLLVYPYNRHKVFFRRNPNGDIEILRVLHETMDLARHL